MKIVEQARPSKRKRKKKQQQQQQQIPDKRPTWKAKDQKRTGVKRQMLISEKLEISQRTRQQVVLMFKDHTTHRQERRMLQPAFKMLF